MSWLTQLIAGMAKPFKWWVIIAPWERGVLVRLGKTATLLQPGPHWRVPFVDRVYVQSVRLRTVADSNQTIGTLDGRVLVVSTALRFIVADMLKLYDSVSNPELALSTLVQGELSQVVATTDSGVLTPALLMERVNGRLGELASWGLADLRLVVTGFAYVRTYRLISNEYRQGAGLYDLEKEHSGER